MMKNKNASDLSTPEPDRMYPATIEGKTAFRQTGKYSIKLAGHLDQPWSEWLGGLEATHEVDGTTVLSGMIPDQSALHGILIRIRDLGLTLISITPGVESPGNRE